MPLPFAGDPALLGQLLVGVSEVDQERRRRQDRKQERSLLVAVPAVFGTLQRIEDIMGDPMQPNIAEECCKKNCLQRLQMKVALAVLQPPMAKSRLCSRR